MLDPIASVCTLASTSHQSGEGPQKPGTGPVETSVPNLKGTDMKATVSSRRKVVGYRLGLFDPDPDIKGVRYVGRTYKTKGRDVALVAAIIASFNQQTADDSDFRLCLAAYPVTA